MLLKATRSLLAVQHHLEVEEHSRGLRVAPGGPGMRKRKVEVGPIPVSCCRQKSICFSCIVQLRSQVSGQLVSGTTGSPELVSGGFSASWNAADVLLGVFLGKNIAEKMREILLSIKLRLWVCLPH